MSESSINTSKDLNDLLAKLENDNKLLAELDGKLKKVNTNNNSSYDTNDCKESVERQTTSGQNKTTAADNKLANNSSSHQLMSTSMPSLYQSSTSSLTDTSAGSHHHHHQQQQQTSYGQCVGTGISANISKNTSTNPSTNLLLAQQNGKLTQQLVDRINADIDLEMDFLEQLDFTTGKHNNPVKNHLLDDNDLLLKTRSSIHTNIISNKYTKFHSKTDGLPYHHNYDPIIKYTGASIQDKTPSITSKDLDKLMAKLDQDNRVLAELDRKLKNVTASGLIEPLSSSLPSLNATSNYLRSSFLADRDRSTTAAGALMGVSSQRSVSAIQPSKQPLTLNQIQHNGQSSQQQQTIQQFLHSLQTPFQQQLDELKLAEDIVDSIEIPNRGRCKVFIARYSYDPFKQSPNDNPEAELTLLAGDFVLIFGNVDEDGFFYGELLDGRRGLIPSNFVEKLTGEDLFEFQASVLYGNRDSESDTASYPPEFYDAILNDQICHSNFQHLLAPDDFHRINDYIDLEDITEIDEDISDLERAEVETAKNTVAPPQRLLLERQLHKSVLIGWLHPECPKSIIDSFQIYVDGVLKATIPSGDRTKALVEGVDSSMPHRISVRAVDRNGHQSKDPACTIVIGKNIPFAPCCVKASNITSDSAIISWIPCNSNFYHVVAVNSVEVRTVRPSVFKHLITGLAANTLYRVSVRAKPGKLLCSDEKNPKKLEMLTTFVDFRTLPKSLPDPPVDIQVESGPQEGTLLVTWLPVTLNQFGTSNNCPVTGYAVFAGHKKLSEIDSPTGDHALLDISTLEHLHKKAITVRTKSGENLSQDSMPCQIPDELLKLPHGVPIVHSKKTHRSDSESDTELTQLLNRVVRRSKAFDPTSQTYDHRTNKQTVSRPTTRTSATTRALQSKHHQQSHHMSHTHQTHHNITGQPIGHHMDHMMDENLSDKDLISRMNIPSIEITKDTPSESINPIESYSEEEFETVMRQRTGANTGANRGYGTSPLPPQRTRAISDYERSHFGPSDHMPNRRAQIQRDRERGVRWFVALFDYDPLTMSPNPDAAEEELPFQEGQLIKIFGDKDADGFYRGEANGRVGFVPCNMVSEVQYDNEADMRRQHQSTTDPWSHLPVRKMVALYDYDPQELSPNVDAEMELAFNTGDIVYVYGDMDEDGFFMGEINGVRGLVPSNFLSETAAAGPGIDANARHGKHQSQVAQRGDLHMMATQAMPPQHPQHPMSGQQGVLSGDTRRMYGPNQSYITGPQQMQGQQQYPGQQMQQHPSQYTHTQQQQQPGHPMSGSQQQYNQQQQQYQQQQQVNQQMMGRSGLRQQVPQGGPMGQMAQMAQPGMQGSQQMQASQQAYNAMYPPGGGLPGNKQRPTSLDLHSTSPRPSSQNNLYNSTQQAQNQQQQHTGMLGSLFASGKKILEEATTPLGARGPFAHPNQNHTAMGHQPIGGGPNAQQGYGGQYGSQQGQQQQQMYGQSGQQMGGPQMMAGQQMGGQQQGGTILNTMKNIFKL